MGLIFETARPAGSAVPERADVACFVGFVARRRSVPLPQAVREQLVASGWVTGPWEREGGVDTLENLPVLIDSWALFDEIFAWDERPVSETPDPVSGQIAHCATYLGAAVRDFFVRGGRRAIVVRVGDPFPFQISADDLISADDRATQQRVCLLRLIPHLPNDSAPAFAFDPTEPSSWKGMHHLYGLSEASLLCLPDLPDICSVNTAPLTEPLPLLPRPEGFVACSGVEAVANGDTDLAALRAPRLDRAGYETWRKAVVAVRGYLDRCRRDVQLVAALPLPQKAPTPSDDAESAVLAHTDMPTFLHRLLNPDSGQRAGDDRAASAFVQLAYPWLRTSTSIDLPEELAPPDGVLAGLLAANALTRGTFRSAAGDFSQRRLHDLTGAEPSPSWGIGPDCPAARLARRVCLFAPMPGGWFLVSDVTTAADEAWRLGGASRLMGVILRTARAWGEAVVFEANGPQLWTRLRRSLEELLARFWQAGALAGSSAAEAFSVRCGPDTMTRNDLDTGRLLVEIAVRPALSVEQITVVLALANPGLPTRILGSAA